MKKSKSQIRLDSDSADELASSALLEPSPRLIRPSTQSSTSETFLARSKSSSSAIETSDKPLPPVSSGQATADSERHKKAKLALAPKTTNMKAPGKEGKQSSEPTISASLRPQVLRPGLKLTSTTTGQTARSTDHVAGPQTSTAEAAELSKKISDLIQQNAAKDSKKRSKRKESGRTGISTYSKLSPLERSKTAFVNATRAITERLGTSNEKQAKSKRKGDAFLDSSDDLPHPETGFLPPLSRGRLDRRIAEGENLSNPKIRDMMGDGHIPRKPLPVYESMKTLKRRPDSMEDPFSDGIDTEHATTPQRSVDLDIGLDIDFSRRKNKRNSGHESSPFRGLSHKTSAINFEPSLSTAEALSRFSNKASGLAQHQEVEFFSSSPVGFSTPRLRLEPRSDADGKKRLTGVLVRTPSILDFSFEEYKTDDDDEPATPAGGSLTTDYEHSWSVKRKSAKEDLRAQLSPLNSNPRRISDASTDELLTTEVSHLDTQDRHPFSTKDINTKIVRSYREARRVKGMSMFDTSNKEEALIAAAAPRSRSVVGSRPFSTSRTPSILFSRESRAHARQLSTTDGDGMDIDELQMDDQAHRIARKKV